jgi:hypothetical protein
MIRISCFIVLLTFFIKLDLAGQASDNFITRNVKDYSKSKLVIQTPKEFIAAFERMH